MRDLISPHSPTGIVSLSSSFRSRDIRNDLSLVEWESANYWLSILEDWSIHLNILNYILISQIMLQVLKYYVVNLIWNEGLSEMITPNSTSPSPALSPGRVAALLRVLQWGGDTSGFSGSYLSALLAKPHPMQWSESSLLLGCGSTNRTSVISSLLPVHILFPYHFPMTF